MTYDNKKLLNIIFQSIASEFEHHPLGAIYYASAIITGLAAGVVWWGNYLDPESAIYPYRWELLVSLVVIATILLMFGVRSHRSNKSEPPSLNPTLSSLSMAYDIQVSRTGRTVIRRDRIKALAFTKVFIYRFRPSGSTTIEAELIEPQTARITGPAFHRSYVLYQVEFDPPLQQDDVVDLCMRYVVDDPNSTMKPFNSILPTNMKSFGCLSLKLSFPTDHPKEVTFEISDTRAGDGALIGEQVGILFPDKNGIYNWKIQEAVKTNTYCVSWKW